MRNIFLSLLILLATSFTSATPITPGTYEQIFLSQGNSYRYTLSLPNNFTHQSKHLLVLALHYGGKVTPFYGKGIIEKLVKPALKDLQPIIIAPDSINGGWSSAENQKQIISLLNYIRAQYKLEQEKAILLGFSMGGKGAWYIGDKYPDQFSAGIILAATPVGQLSCEIPWYVIHSRRDEIFPLLPTQLRIQQLKSLNCSVGYQIIDDITHHQTAEYVKSLSQVIPWFSK